MSQEHVKQLGDRLAAEARGRHYVEETLYSYDTKEGKRVFGTLAGSKERRYDLKDRATSRSVATLRVESLPGCCGILLLHGFWGEPRHVITFIEMACRAGKRSGYGQVMLTLRAESDIAVRLLDAGWTVQTFLNGKTNHTVTLLTKTLEQTPRTVTVSATASE